MPRPSQPGLGQIQQHRTVPHSCPRAPAKCAEKFGEEAVEAIVAAALGDRSALAAEAADVLYHLQVMLAAAGVDWAIVLAELERREGTSGLAEKASRTS